MLSGWRKNRSRGWIAAAAGCLLPMVACCSERLPLAPRLTALGLKEIRLAEGASVFSNRYHQIVVRANSRRIEHDGVSVYLNGGVTLENGRWYIDKVDWAEGIGFPWIEAPVKPVRRTSLVLLDPGHGGLDKGAISPRQVEESRVTLDLARRVGKLLAARGVTVKYTRSEQVSLSLDQRVDLNRKLKPDVFVSIHANATASRAINGVETFIVPAPGYEPTNGGRADPKACDGNRNAVLNMALGYAIQDNLLAYTGAEDRGLKRARFYVIRHSPVPAALVEVGFLTNPGEESLLISRVYRDRVASGIARGILSYLTTRRKPPTGKTE